MTRREEYVPHEAERPEQNYAQANAAGEEDEPMEIFLPSTRKIRYWTLQDVSDFVVHHTRNINIAARFVQEEIDGRALLLLTEKDLTDFLGMQYASALKLLIKVHWIRDYYDPHHV